MRVLFLLLAFCARLTATDIFLSVNPPYGDGSSQSAPLNANYPNLDSIWAQKSPSTFHYAPGLYQTLGWGYQKRQTMVSNSAHIGSGMGITTIQLVGAHDATQDGVIFAQDGGAWITNWTISNLTCDVNASGNLKFTQGLGALGAIDGAGGDNILVDHIEVINFGTGRIGTECFPVSFFGSWIAGTMQNIVIQNCVFHRPAAGNKDGCTVVGINDAPQNKAVIGPNCVVKNCSFASCKGDFSYCHCIGAPWALNNSADSSGVFFYTEPAAPQWASTTIEISGNIVSHADAFFISNPHSGGSLACAIGFAVNTLQ